MKNKNIMKNFKKINLSLFIILNLFLTASLSAFAGDFPKIDKKSKNLKAGFYKTDNAKYVHDFYDAIELKDSGILIIGGGSLSDNKANVEIFNPKTFKFSKTSKPVYNHYFRYSSILLNNGKVLIMADNDKKGKDRVFFFETYDPKKNIYDDTVYSINGDCSDKMYKTPDENAAVYCREYTDNFDEKVKLPETVETMNIYNSQKERFEKKLYPKDNGYINKTELAKSDNEKTNLHTSGTAFINIPKKNMLLFMGIDIPEEIKNAKTLEELFKPDLNLSPSENMSKKAYIFVYEN